ncbi:insulin receptor [Sergentomyia squamirostris]
MCGFFVGETTARECGSIDIRNKLSQFEKLRNCTVVSGYLNIVLLDRFNESHWTNLSFPELREITGMLVIFRVFGLKSFKQLFPNLTVIRGQDVLANYALVVFEMPDLENLGLRSLLSVQRGYVRIEKNPKLCYANTIDWDKITQTAGGNYIQKDIRSDCPNATTNCTGCEPKFCWSPHNCQRFEGSYLLPHFQNCDYKCLGGCKNNTCFVCRGITDGEKCVDTCEPPKILNIQSVRCITKQKCIAEGKIVHDGKCLSDCPNGFMNVTNKCQRCKNSCPKVCYGMQIDFIENAEKLRGCTILNGSLQIKLNTDMAKLLEELESNLGGIQEIYGFLKIYRSAPITSLNFLRSLHTIHGEELENGQFALVVYENSNLQKLFDFDYNRDEMNILNGGMMFHYNQKLCYTEIQNLQKRSIYNKTLDYISKESNGYKHACDMETIRVDFDIISTTSVRIFWEQYHTNEKSTLEGYLIYLIEAPKKDITTYFGRDSCSRHSWRPDMISKENLVYDKSRQMYAYNITDLVPGTQYAFYVRTYLSSEGINAQSIIKYIQMPIDRLSAPAVKTIQKTSDSITLGWHVQPAQKSLVAHFNVEMYERPYNQALLDTRDYCAYPRRDEMEGDKNEAKNCCSADHDDETYQILKLHTNFEPYIDCDEDPFQPGCHLFEYDRFVRQVELLAHQCHLFHGHNSLICQNTNTAGFTRWAGKRDSTVGDTSTIRIRVDSFKNNITVNNLMPYTLYTFQVFACSVDFVCSSYYSHNERTTVDVVADIVRNVSIFDAWEGQSIALQFMEPFEPNGLTVAFKVEIRRMEGNQETETVCITRKEHALNKNIFQYETFDMLPGLYSFRVQAISLATDGPWSDYIFYRVIEKETTTIVQKVVAGICITVSFLIVLFGVFWWTKHYETGRQERRIVEDRVDLLSAQDLDPDQQNDNKEILEMHELIREKQRRAEMSESERDVRETGSPQAGPSHAEPRAGPSHAGQPQAGPSHAYDKPKPSLLREHEMLTEPENKRSSSEDSIFAGLPRKSSYPELWQAAPSYKVNSMPWPSNSQLNIRFRLGIASDDAYKVPVIFDSSLV